MTFHSSGTPIGKLAKIKIWKSVSWVDGEMLAGEVVGWNFGDGHLHHEVLLNSIQKRCNYDSGELRVIMVESPQFHTQNMEYRIYDAKDGLIEKGIGNTKKLKEQQPWEN